MIGHVLSQATHPRRQVPFKDRFKAVFGLALAAILLVGFIFSFLDDGIAARLMLPIQSVAALIGAVVGWFGAQSGPDAPTD